MKKALTLAKLSLGLSSPNPPVGAVIVKDGEIVGEGFTQEIGGDHAEIVALGKAGDLASGATMYVTMEPCSHYGRTPPCSDALIKAGIRRVFMAVTDPNPKVNGKGNTILKQAGIETSIGNLADEAQDHYQAYFKFIKTGKPLVVAKYAMTLDGKIATRSGDSQWVTGERSRAIVHSIRSQMDAIITAPGTVRSDNPKLTARDAQGTPLARQPLRVVVDSRGRTPKDATLFSQPGNTLIVTGSEEASGRFDGMGDNVSTVVLADDSGKVDLEKLMTELGSRGILQVMTEAGETLLGAFFDDHLPDQVIAFVAPSIVGGAESPSPVAGIGIEKISDAFSLDNIVVEGVENDVLVRGRLKSWD